jgi:coenzyme F420-reducing hydrogenase beta subunit
MRNIGLNKQYPKAAPPCFSQIGDNQCTGCAGCANACHQSAIKMELNQDGFYRPILRENLCDGCLACLQHCAVLVHIEHPETITALSDNPDVYAAWSCDKEVHLSSSSGGIFSELARHILNQDGVVCGCEWGEHWIPRHVMIRTWDDVPRLRGSKYIPSNVSERFYRGIIELANTDTTVLFCGTPCQVAGLKCIAPPAARDNLILVDLVCHGVPSLTSFQKYLAWRFGGTDNLEYFAFRNKEISVATICAITKSGSKYLASVGSDCWYRAAMVYHMLLQRSCFDCQFASLPRCGDITLGDFWGIPESWHDPHGDSVVLANTNKGKYLLQLLIESDSISVRKSNYETATAKISRLRGSIYPVPQLRDLSLRLFAAGRSFSLFYNLIYLPLSFRERAIGYVKRRLQFLSNIGQRIWPHGAC